MFLAWKALLPPMSTLFRQVENLIAKVASECCLRKANPQRYSNYWDTWKNLAAYLDQDVEWQNQHLSQYKHNAHTSTTWWHPWGTPSRASKSSISHQWWLAFHERRTPHHEEATPLHYHWWTPWISHNKSRKLDGRIYAFQSSMLIFHYKMLGCIMYQTLFQKLAWI